MGEFHLFLRRQMFPSTKNVLPGHSLKRAFDGSRSAFPAKLKSKIVSVLATLFFAQVSFAQQVFYPMSSGDYLQEFTDIANWANNYTAGVGASNWRVATSVPTSAVTSITVFSSGASGGVQKGTGAIVFLATGTNSGATDLLLDFSGRTAGALTFSYSKVANTVNDTDPRTSDLKVQYSLDNGATFTDLTGYTVPRITNNSSPEAGTISINLPSQLNSQSQVVIRFFFWNNNQTTGSGNRPKWSVDNVTVTSGSAGPSVSVSPSSLVLPTTTQGSNGVSTNFTARGNLLSTNITVTAVNSNDFAISTNNSNFTNTLTLPTNSSGAVTNTLVYVRLTGALAGFPSNAISLVSGTNSASISVRGTVDPPPVQPAISVSTSTLPGFSSLIGVASSITNFTAGGSNLTTNISVAAPAGFSIAFSANDADFTNTLTLTNIDGIASNRTIHVRMDAFGAATNIAPTNITLTTPSGNPQSVSVSGVVQAPQITLSTNSLSGFSTFAGSFSTNQSFTAGGSNLIAPIVLTASNGYEISTNPTTGFGTTVTLGGGGGGTIAIDNGGNYTSSTWTNGANAGSGFRSWAITTGGGGSAGNFIANPASAGITTDSIFGTNAFGLYANPANSGAFVNADREFDQPLQVGETFSFQWAINWDSGQNGAKGFDVYTGTPGSNSILSVNNGGSGTITFNNTDTGFGFGTVPMTWSMFYSNATTLVVTGTDRDGSGTFTTNVTVSAPPRSFRFYAFQLQQTGNDNPQPYFNNFLISAPSSGAATNVPLTTIYVRISATNSANSALLGGITATTTGATNSPQISLSGEVKALPSIPTVNTLTPFITVSGTASAAQLLTVIGANLTNPLTVALPQFFQVSTNGAGGPFQGSPLILSNTNSVGGLNTPIWLRVGSNAPITSGLVATNLVLSSGSALTNLAVSYRVNSTNPSLSVTPSNLPTILSTQGSPSSGSFLLQGSSLPGGVTNTASSPFLVSTASGGPFVGSLTVPLSSGLVSTNIFVQVGTSTPPGVYSGTVAATSGTNTASVAVVASVIASGGAPQIVVSTNSLTNFYSVQSFPSTNQTFLAAGFNLTNTSITVGVAGSNYEISTNGSVFTNNVTLAASGGQVPPTTIWARLSSNAVVGSNVSTTISLVAGSASNSVALSGKVDPLRPPVVTLVAPSANPTIIAPGSSVLLQANVVDTDVSGGAGTLSKIEFRAGDVPIAGASTSNVVSPANFQFSWTPGATNLPAAITAVATDTDNLSGTNTNPVVVRFPFAGEPVVGFAPPSANGAVTCVAPADGGSFYIGGAFSRLVRTTTNSTTNHAPGLARLLSNGVVDTNFAPATNGFGGSVLAISPGMDGKTLVAGGTFTNFGGEGRVGLVLLSNTGAVITNFNAGFTGSVKINAIARQHDGKLLVGGLFAKTLTNAGGTNLSLQNLVRLDPSNGAIDPTFLPNPNGEVSTIAVQKNDGMILVGGTFGTVEGLPRNNLARLHPAKLSTNQTTLVDTNFVTGSGPEGPVQSIAVLDDGSVLVGGRFFGYNNTTFYNNLIKLGTNGALDPAFNFSGLQGQGGFSGQVTDIQIRPTGPLFITGAFTNVWNLGTPAFVQSAGRVAQLLPSGGPDPAFRPGVGANNAVFEAAHLASGNVAIVGSFTTFNNIPLQNIAVLTGYDGFTPVLTSPRFLRVNAGQEFVLPFTISTTQTAPSLSLGGGLPNGVRFHQHKLEGIPLQSGLWTVDVNASAGGVVAAPVPFRILVESNSVPYATWQKAWEWMEGLPEGVIGGPSSKVGNPSGQNNFTIYALSGGNPRRESGAFLPEPRMVMKEGGAVPFLHSEINPLAEAKFTPEYAPEPSGPWQAVPQTPWQSASGGGIEFSSDGLSLSAYPPLPPGAMRQFMRLRITPDDLLP